MMSRIAGTVAMTTTALVVAALPAAAHPTFRPGNAPANETTTVEFVIPHSCGAEGGMPETDQEQSPTTIVDVQVPDDVTIAPHDKNGWTLLRTDDGFTWTAHDPNETTIVFLVDVTLDGADGDEHYVNVYQECENGRSFSWIGSPSVEAEYPAAILTVGHEAGSHEHGGSEHHSEEPSETHDPDSSEGSEPEAGAGSEHAASDGNDGEAVSEPEVMESTSDERPGATEDLGAEADGGSAFAAIALIVVAMAALGGLLAWRRRRTTA